MRTPGTAAELEQRRRWAATLLSEGKTIAEVVRITKASLSSVKRWKKAVEQGGFEALAAKPPPVRQSKLTTRQKEQLRKVLIRGPLAAGYRTDLWTCRRVAEVVSRRFGVTYHPDHLGRLLHALGFSPQRPEQRAREANDEAIQRWRAEDWPCLKKKGRNSKLASSSSTKAGSACNR